MFNISDFLKNFDKRTTNGICKACNASVGWSRSKLASHKRANCKGAAEDEYEIFLGKFPRKSRNKSESARISHCANTDAVKKSDSKKRNTRRVELPSGEPSDGSFIKDNCYVCNETMTSCRTKLSFKIKLTGTPLYEILESFTGIELSQSIRNDSQVCHDCLTSFQQYDKWQHKSLDLQRRMMRMHSVTHTELVYIKQEPDYYDDFSDRSNETEESSDEKPPSKVHKTVQSDSDDDRNESHKEEDENTDDDWLPDHYDTTADQQFSCETCSKDFRSQDLYDIHVATDHERCTFPVQCKKCTESFDSLTSLKDHYRNHSKSNFKTNKSLWIDDNSRPYACDKPGCSKRFYTNYKLQTHLRVHTGEKIFECPHCPGKMFAQRWGLSLHIKKRHADRSSRENEVCKICEVRFISKSKLKVHLETVHDVVLEPQ